MVFLRNFLILALLALAIASGVVSCAEKMQQETAASQRRQAQLMSEGEGE